jgi:phosphatidylglycerol:prolipoprotein diacylglycerol transferase
MRTRKRGTTPEGRPSGEPMAATSTGEPGSPRAAAAAQTSKRAAASADAEAPQALITTFSFDSGDGRRPYSARVRLSGRHFHAIGPRGRQDEFVRDEIIEGILPHNGAVSITASIDGIERGAWAVRASLVTSTDTTGKRSRSTAAPASSRRVLAPAQWSWRRWSLVPAPDMSLRTRWAPLAPFDRRPAVIPGSYAILVALGVSVALLAQRTPLVHDHIAPSPILTASLMALAGGLMGAKLWYVALHLRSWREAIFVGWCIQGFVLGSTVILAAVLSVWHLPVGVVLDAVAPGMLLGLAVGRIGCFFTGCCAGRISASRWALWSSDGRVGARRIPTQLWESLAAAAIGAASWFSALHADPGVPGVLFAASYAAYTLSRQLVLRFRAERRRSVAGSPLVAGLSAVVLVAALFAQVVTGR